MSGRVLLHIGAMKTGTTFIQHVLLQHPDQLAAAGLEFLATFRHQRYAVLKGLSRSGNPRRNLRPWRQLVAGAREDRTSIISMEFLSFARPRQVAAFLEPLRGRDVHVVLTARDQLRVLPGQWQSYTRNFGTATWAEYLRDVCVTTPPPTPSRAYRRYHRAQDLVRIVDTWRSRPEVGRFDVVAGPPPGAPREELWLRFCRAAEITVPGISIESVYDNPSIGYASCDVLRRLNAHLGAAGAPVPDDRTLLSRVLHHGTPPREQHTVAIRGYSKLIRTIARESLEPLSAAETKPLLNRDAAAYAVARNGGLRDLLADEQIRLVGDPEDLPAQAVLPEFPATVAPPPAEHVKRAAQAVWDHAARATGRSAARPKSLNRLVADAGQMLRAVADKNRRN